MCLSKYGNECQYKQLFIQLDAVLNATPLLRIESGKISLGRTQPMGPKETPYANVNRYIPLVTEMLQFFQIVKKISHTQWQSMLPMSEQTSLTGKILPRLQCQNAR